MSDVAFARFTSEPFGDWLGTYRWDARELTYSFPDRGVYFEYQRNSDISPLEPQQQAAARAVLAEIQSFTQLRFREVTESLDIQATLRFAQEVGLRGGYAYLPDNDDAAGDGFFGKFTTMPTRGNEDFLFFLHEIGHAMGLDHGHEFPDFAGGPFNSQEFTLMTYTDYIGDTATDSLDTARFSWAQSFMQLDIAAMQFLYGANHDSTAEIWSGDSIYRFDPMTGAMSVNGADLGAPAGNHIFRTIWDGNGEDTYDLSNYATELRIDLGPGAFSVFSEAQLADLNGFSDDPAFLARGNIANALLSEGDRRGLIENAKGGVGDDQITGNPVANKLFGGAGDDHLDGRGGGDHLFGGRGNDRILAGDGDDKVQGGEGRDRLRGEQGDDRLFGLEGADVMRGGAGRDQLLGGAGADRLTGGAGRDVFIYNAGSDAPVAERTEMILGFNPEKDVIDFSDLVSRKLAFFGVGGLQDGTKGVALARSGQASLIRVDLDADGRADMEILVVGVRGLEADDFLL